VIYIYFPIFILDRHKSVYHQPGLSTYNPSEKRKKRHRRSRPSMEPTDTSFKSIPSSEATDSTHIGKRIFDIYIYKVENNFL